MAGVFREVTISYGGKDHTFTPDMRLIRRIERGDGDGPVSIIAIMNSGLVGSPQVGFMSWLVSVVMTYAGAKVDEAELYREMMSNSKDAKAVYNGVIAALSPAEKEQKKDAAPDE